MMELSERQSMEFTDSYQLHIAMQDAVGRAKHYAGSMHWKTISGNEYLYRMLDAYGKGKSLGPRSDETEAKYSAFQQGKAEAADRIASIQRALDEKAALNRAVGLNRVPLVVGRICRELDKRELLGSHVLLVGTHAIYGYEALAGALVRRELMATADADFLWDNRKKVDLAADAELDGFMAVLKKADRSFKRSKQLFRAINKDGYMADLIVPEPNNPLDPMQEQMGNVYDLKASGIGSLRWLVNAPKVEAVAIDKKGYPFRMVVPDPRAFAIHKLWVSEQSNRKADKAKRDREQAIAVADMVIERLPQFKFEADALKMFPKAVAEKGLQAARGNRNN